MNLSPCQVGCAVQAAATAGACPNAFKWQRAGTSQRPAFASVCFRSGSPVHGLGATATTNPDDVGLSPSDSSDNTPGATRRFTATLRAGGGLSDSSSGTGGSFSVTRCSAARVAVSDGAYRVGNAARSAHSCAIPERNDLVVGLGPAFAEGIAAHCLCAQTGWCFQSAALWPCLLCRPVRQCASSSRQRSAACSGECWLSCRAADWATKPIRAGRVGVAVMAAHDGRLDGHRKSIRETGPIRSSRSLKPVNPLTCPLPLSLSEAKQQLSVARRRGLFIVTIASGGCSDVARSALDARQVRADRCGHKAYAAQRTHLRALDNGRRASYRVPDWEYYGVPIGAGRDY